MVLALDQKNRDKPKEPTLKRKGLLLAFVGALAPFGGPPKRIVGDHRKVGL